MNINELKICYEQVSIFASYHKALSEIPQQYPDIVI